MYNKKKMNYEIRKRYQYVNVCTYSICTYILINFVFNSLLVKYYSLISLSIKKTDCFSFLSSFDRVW